MYGCSGLASIVGWKGHIIRYLPGHVPSQYGLLANLRKEWEEEKGDVLKIWVILWGLIMGYHRIEYIAPGRGSHQTGTLEKRQELSFIHDLILRVKMISCQNKRIRFRSIKDAFLETKTFYLSPRSPKIALIVLMFLQWGLYFHLFLQFIQTIGAIAVFVFALVSDVCMPAADLDGTTWIWHSGEQSRQSLSAAFSSCSCHSLWYLGVHHRKPIRHMSVCNTVTLKSRKQSF